MMRKPATGRRARVPATTASTQDYLAAIYDLGGSGKPVIGARLAKHMSVSAPAVTEAMHRMARGGYVKVGHGKQLTLTPKGHQIAEVMARRHRLLERWLTDTLGLNWTDAHEEAHRLEHALSPRVEDRLAEMLGMPSTCRSPSHRPRKARPSSSSASQKRRKPTRSFSSISGATRSGPAVASRSSRWRRGPARSRPAATVRQSRSGCPPRRRSGSTDRLTHEGERR